MLPHHRNKVDVNAMTEEEKKLFRLYGKLPSKREVLQNKLKERKYFDSGDYALSKAGKASDVGVTNIGSKHPLPENIPHSHSSGGNSVSGVNSGSPVKESMLHAKSPMGSQEPLEREDDDEEEKEQPVAEESSAPKSPPPAGAVMIPSH